MAVRRTGVYVCEGCGIGECVSGAALLETAAGEPGVTVTRTSAAFCLEDSARIREDVESEGLEAVVIAACSPRVNRQVFDLRPALVRRVNLREHVAWSQAPQDEATQELATDLLRMGVAAAQHMTPPVPLVEDCQRRVLVVGAGPAGLSAALSAAEGGYAVTLVEREEQPGGFLRRLHRGYPTRPPYQGLEPVDVEGLVARVLDHPSVTLRTRTTVGAVEGQPGRFQATLEGPGGAETVEVGSVVMATGFEPVAAAHFAGYGLGENPDVISSVEMEDLCRAGELLRPSDGRPARRVAILACDGPADSANLPYTGNVTGMTALKQAMYVRERDPEAEVFLVYEDMQTPGRDELYYRRVQEDHGVFLVRGQVRAVESAGANGDAHLRVTAQNTVLAGDVVLEADLVVVQQGMVPTSALPAGSTALSLRYLQGGAMPTGRAGFADSNFLCFPYETRRTGIYSAGCVHRAQDIAQSRRDGAAAALKAIQVVEKAASGQAVHPRVGELGYPQFLMSRCTACGRCTQECPFGALELDAQRHPVINTNRCRRCGICMGACPVQVISFPDYSVEQISAMQKVISLPEDDEERLRVLVFACENDAYPALDMAGINRLRLPVELRVVPVRCLGSVNAVVVADAVQRGFDGVALLGCRSGPDYQCHFIQGSELLGKRMDNVRETLGRLALEEERVQVLETSIADARRLPGVLGGFVEQVRGLGPNPMKGF
ncbi:MAG TPA: FAD-dependent oxidoreductase [Candidatus Dormibacteraeota bacterium]|jgi:quinone-modifying oxidoreductase subunit QmoB|nr:FAD-dependent oxidoreductase [Candidatus Dormibacteraeota bacterium]